MYSRRSAAGSVHDQANRSTNPYQVLSKYAKSGLSQPVVATLYFALMNQLHGGPAVGEVTNRL